MDLFLREASGRIDPDDVLSKIDRLIDWRSFSPILTRDLGRSGIGPQGCDPLLLFKCLLIGQWHGLSDPKLKRALKVRRHRLSAASYRHVRTDAFSLRREYAKEITP